MSKFTLQIKLKQHTPIIHFESLQEATIRATELKPKLDRFLIEKAKSEKKDHKNLDYKPWKKSKDHNALNYKVKVIADKVDSYLIPKESKIPIFFGNKGNIKKYLSFTKEEIKLSFFSLNEELLQYIDVNFNEFISRTNFGSCQNKGYGSFGVINEKEMSSCLNDYSYLEYDYDLDLKGNKYNEKNKYLYQRKLVPLNIIEEYFKKLNNKVNFTKKNFKNDFLKKTNSKQCNESEKIMLYQSIVVFAGNFIANNSKKRCRISINNEDVDRFISPLVFKPIKVGNQWRIYLLPRSLPRSIEGKLIKFENFQNKESFKLTKQIFDTTTLIEDFNCHVDKKIEVEDTTINIKKS